MPVAKNWTQIRSEFEDGAPVELLSARHKVSAASLNTKIKNENWKTNVHRVVLTVGEDERQFWKSYIETVADHEKRYNMQRISALIQSEPLLNTAENTILRKINQFAENIDPGLPNQIEQVKAMAQLTVNIRASRSEMLERFSLMTGDAASGVSPFSITYNSVPPDGPANGHGE